MFVNAVNQVREAVHGVMGRTVTGNNVNVKGNISLKVGDLDLVVYIGNLTVAVYERRNKNGI